MPYVAKPKVTKKRRVPIQARAIERVNKILDTTLELMGDPQHNKISTHLIAEKAGVSVGSVYQFFPNVESIKIALIERLLDQYYDHFSDTIKNHPDVNDLVEFSQLLINTTYEFYQAHPDIIGHIVASSGTQEFNEVNGRLNERVQELMMDYITYNSVDLDEKTVRRKISVAIATGDVMTMFIWSAETQEERDAYLQDWKDIAGFYHALN